MQIAVYGKGGIGKSTVSANLSAALAMCGCRVLQIGCDPKHDSTRLLHHGRKVVTILDYLLDTPEDAQSLDGILMEGFRNVGCVEAGGPKPGMGCAGRGILTAFEFLNRFRTLEQYDQVVYDVLGDVVCGGFAVPVRKQYADAVFLVTSGENMAIYAANNILQGIRNLDPNAKRIAGILYNSRGVGDKATHVEAFAQAVGLPILARIPRSDVFAQAEQEAVTLAEWDIQAPETQIFLELARLIVDGPVLYEANPLSEEQMEAFMRGGIPGRRNPEEKALPVPEIPLEKAEASASKKRALSDPFSRVPLFGCAYRGAVDLAVHIKDAAVLGHAPKSCTWYAVNGISSYARRGLYERGVLYPAFIPRQFENTDITVEDAVFGGVAHAREKAMKLAARGVKSIIAVTSCIPGMSGDDLTPVKKELKALGVDMYIIHTDGIEAGDYNEGMALCYKTLAQEAVDPTVLPESDCINLVYEHTISSQTDRTFTQLQGLLAEMGIRINCRFLCAETMENIHNFLRAPYSILVRSERLGLELKEIFETKYGCRFLKDGLPRGFSETARWLREIGSLYHREAEAEAVIAKHRMEYLQRIQSLRPLFAHKKVVFFLNNRNLDWLFELSDDLGWNIVRTVLIGRKGENVSNWSRRFSSVWADDRDALKEAIECCRPDLVVLDEFGSISCLPPEICVANVQRDVGTGFFSGIECAQQWSKSLENTLEGRWKHDRALFEKCCC